MRNVHVEADIGELWAEPSAPASLSRIEWGILLATLVTLYSALPTAIVRDVLHLSVPLWPFYFSIYGLVGLVLAARAPVGRWLAPQVPLIAYSTLPIVSVAWSEAPVETVLQAATLLGTVMVGICMVTAVRPREALRVFAMACVVGACLDFVFSAALPQIGVHQDGPWAGTWKGLHDQKNGLGAISVLSIMILVAAVRDERRFGLANAVGIAIALVVLAASKSTTSWLVATTCAPFLLLSHGGRRVAALVVPVVITAAIAAMMILPDFAGGLLEALPQLVGKDSTLSNRLPIWVTVDPFIEDRWWLGFGYGAFWSSSVLPATLFQERMFFVPTSAHSSYIEVRLALGMFGIAATLATLIYIVAVLAKAHLAEARPGAIRDPVLPLVLPYLLYLTLTSLTESVLLQRNTIMWVIFVWLTGVAAQRAFAAREAGPRQSDGSAWLRIR
jgi:exopolysaccharide production protein ExoQ